MNKSTESSWHPTPKQAKFLSLPYSILEGFYAGAVAAGKTDVLLLYPIIHRFHENPKFKGLFLRRTFPELKNEVIPRSRHFFRRLGANYNTNDKVWTFPSGALFFFGHVENEDDVHNYDSMQPNYVAFDELTSFTEWQYLYITLQRVRTLVGSPLPAIVRSASNPGNIGHAWVKKRFVDPCPTGEVLIQSKSGIKRIFIPATVYDNPYIDPNYLKQLEAIPDRAEREAKLHGKWDSFEGQVFEEFRDRRFPDEPDEALHVIDPFEIPSFWPKIVAMDWGYAPPAMQYVCYGAVSPARQIVVYREQAWQKTRIADWAPYVKEFTDQENPKIIKLCKSGGQDRGQEHTIHSEIETAIGKSVELTNNASGSRIAGKQLLHEYLRWKQKYNPEKKLLPFSQTHAEWLMRNRGQKEYNLYLSLYQHNLTEEKLPKLLIFNSCPLMISAIKNCVYDPKKTEDVAEFPGDDPYDTCRYLLDAVDRYFDESKSEFDKVNRTEAILEELERTGDMTAFYRNARRLDTSSYVQPVRRYHHAR